MRDVPVDSGPVSAFIDRHFRHFNAREMRQAAAAYRAHTAQGGKMMVALAGAMSTAELGRSLAEMIRRDQVHAISATAANLEEDLFNLVGQPEYRLVPGYRNLSTDEEVRLRDEGFNRVTDTCIPETVLRHIEQRMLGYWKQAEQQAEAYFPFEYAYRLLADSEFRGACQVPWEDSWVAAAAEKNLPIYTPGYEDSTLGNIFTARVIDGSLGHHRVVRSGTEQMEQLVQWYLETQQSAPIGFFQIGGGIAGDFAICAVPLIIQDLRRPVGQWSYFCQISDSTTSYGSYSGAVPNEKITWYKLQPDAPKFMIQSDATIVAPLLFAYVLGW